MAENAVDVKSEVRKKEENQEPEKKLVIDLEESTIRVRSEAISPLSEDEDKAVRVIAEAVRVYRAGLRKLQRQRNAKIMRARGTRAVIID